MAKIFLVRYDVEEKKDILGAFQNENSAKSFMNKLIELSVQYQRIKGGGFQRKELGRQDEIDANLQILANQINELLSDKSKYSFDFNFVFGPESGNQNPFDWFTGLSQEEFYIDEIELQNTLFEGLLFSKYSFKRKK